ncbi:EAL domain-containing protein [Neobacillus vireti]|uniref:PAS/PAC sensor-containing diguanylate cyclase/phosphodiesterase n=1 Tax=Neobacillus vireti LMG 21834 TaxID=1131730 RepID=A0AB94IQT7_9BACI|nr:EAL domain-containing protein [Neobacillus vireti]ETI69362.1 PAS/PAC sensor-containing diguanylate cyclase/phosphodiesterase [Neobacillus vireti LMG 21834]
MKRLFNRLAKETNSIQLIDSEEEFPSIINDYLLPVIQLDVSGNVISCNRSFTKQFGYTEQDLKKPFLKIYVKEYRNELKQYFKIAQSGHVQTFNTIGIGKNGKTFDIRVTYIPTESENGTIIYVIISNITELKEKEREILLFENRLKSIEGIGEIGSFHYDILNDCTHCSKQAQVIFGKSVDEDFSPTYTQLLELIHPNDYPILSAAFKKTLKDNSNKTVECRIVMQDQSIRHVFVQLEAFLGENRQPVRVMGFIQDITEQKMLIEQVQHLSFHDYLTNLPNRRMFDGKLQQLTDGYRGNNKKFAVMIFDIDHFKYINDTLGHPIGDDVLNGLSARLLALLSPDDLLARIGGDEFGLLIANMASIDSLKELADRIINCLKEPFYIKGYELFLTASIGISIYPDDGVTSHELLRNADIALFKAEELGRNNYKIISPSSSIESYKLFSLGRDLLKALENNEMVLYFQPRVDASSGKIISAEALIRWEHPEWGLVSPAEFLMLAEENGLIIQIEDWVLNEVCQQLKTWKEAMLSTVPISINISATHFMKQNWLETVEETIRNAGIRPTDLEFEITENSFLNNEEIVNRTIISLKEMGIKISLDDFGKGYSSLSYLAQFPFDFIKIDKLFIQNMIESHHDLFIVKSIIYLAKGLDIDVVAEGVETIEQLKLLKKEKCQQIQGYLFSRPVPVKEIEPLLQKKILQPIDPKLKEKQSKRKYYRVNFPYPLAAKMTLLSIAGKPMRLGKSSVLIEDISIGGLRYLSTLKLPVRDDVILQFEFELLSEVIKVKGHIVWKEDNDELTEYGIEFIIKDKDQSDLGKLLNRLNLLLKNNVSLPSYGTVVEDKDQYFQGT